MELAPNEIDKSSTNSTRLYVPGWWAHAWEQALIRQSVSELNLTPGLDTVVLPSLDITQLNFLAMLFDRLKQQMLDTSWQTNQSVKLYWNEAKKLISSTDTASLSKLATALEQLGGIRLTVRNANDVGQRQKSLAIFKAETWSKNEDDSSDVVLTLTTSDQTFELLMGYTDGHVDFLRHLSDQPCSADVLALSPPLILWKPVWLELPLAEQAVYMRMEQSMQWDMTWLQLDGVFDASLEKLFDHVRLAKRGPNSNSVLMERLRICGRLGRKLISHGVMAREPQSNFFAVTPTSSSEQKAGPSIVWQASTERLKSLEENAYFGRAAQTMLRFSVEKAIPSILKVFSAGTEYAARQRDLLAIWTQLKNQPGGALRVGQTTLMQAHVLFLEWSLRSLPGALFPLPEGLHSEELLKFCRLDGQVAERFRCFSEKALSNHDLSRTITEIVRSSFGSPARMVWDDRISLLRTLIKEPVASVFAAEEPKSAPVISVKPNMPTNPTPPSPLLSSYDPGQATLLRIAREELDKMMKADLRSFSALKEAYMKSLEVPQRQLMSDVERRMKPQQFDQQLKQRLVRFMVEHPSAWKSTSQILQ